jgi:hypothetical protein
MADTTNNQHTESEYTPHEWEQVLFEEWLQDQFEEDQRRYAEERDAEDERPEEAALAVWNENCNDAMQVDEHVEDYRLEHQKIEREGEAGMAIGRVFYKMWTLQLREENARKRSS